MNVGQSINVDVLDLDSDGTTPDVTETLTLQTTNSAVCGATVDPTNNRRVKITGVGAGTANVTVSAPGVPGAGLLTIPVVVAAAPVNLSRIDFVSASAPF